MCNTNANIDTDSLLWDIRPYSFSAMFTMRQSYLWSTVHCKPIPVMKTGFSLCHISNREKPVFINWEPCNENRIFPVWKYYTGKTLFWPCTAPVRDCSTSACAKPFFGLLRIYVLYLPILDSCGIFMRKIGKGRIAHQSSLFIPSKQDNKGW